MMGTKFLKAALVFLHGLIGLVSGFFCLYTQFSKNNSSICVPKLMDNFGAVINFQNGLPILCQSLVYGMGAVCILNFVMCVVNTFMLKNTGVVLLHWMVTSVYMAFSVLGGSLITIYYIVWCDILQHIVVDSKECSEAATEYDRFNSTAEMSSSKSRMEIQMASIWAMFPITCCTLMAYLLTLNLAAQTNASGASHIRYIVEHDENTPLIRSVNRSTSSGGDLTSDRSPAVSTEESSRHRPFFSQES